VCARMKHLPTVILDGQPLEDAVTRGRGSRTVAFNVKDDQVIHTGWLNGHAREETVRETFLVKGWRVATIPAALIEEQDQEFNVAPRARILAIVKTVNPGTPQEKNIVNIVTREAKTSAEEAIHGRWPSQLREAQDENGNVIMENGRPKLEFPPYVE
jgi:hypothetical protein